MNEWHALDVPVSQQLWLTQIDSNDLALAQLNYEQTFLTCAVGSISSYSALVFVFTARREAVDRTTMIACPAPAPGIKKTETNYRKLENSFYY